MNYIFSPSGIKVVIRPSASLFPSLPELCMKGPSGFSFSFAGPNLKLRHLHFACGMASMLDAASGVRIMV